MIFQSLVIFYVKSILVDLVKIPAILKSKTSETVIFTHLEAVNLGFDEFQSKKIGQNLKT